jgi:hypothetical protein
MLISGSTVIHTVLVFFQQTIYGKDKKRADISALTITEALPTRGHNKGRQNGSQSMTYSNIQCHNSIFEEPMSGCYENDGRFVRDRY